MHRLGVGNMRLATNSKARTEDALAAAADRAVATVTPAASQGRWGATAAGAAEPAVTGSLTPAEVQAGGGMLHIL